MIGICCTVALCISLEASTEARKDIFVLLCTCNPGRSDECNRIYQRAYSQVLLLLGQHWGRSPIEARIEVWKYLENALLFGDLDLLN